MVNSNFQPTVLNNSLQFYVSTVFCCNFLFTLLIDYEFYYSRLNYSFLVYMKLLYCRKILFNLTLVYMQNNNIFIFDGMRNEEVETLAVAQRQHLEKAPFPRGTVDNPTSQDLQEVYDQQLINLPADATNLQQHQENDTVNRPHRPYNGHKQLSGDKRDILEKYISIHINSVQPDEIVALFGISRQYALYLIKQFKKKGNLSIKTTRRGRKKKVNEDMLRYLKVCMEEDCRLTDKELSEKLKEKYSMDKPLHHSSICNYRHKEMEELGLGRWTVKIISKRGEGSNSDEQKENRILVMNKLLYYRNQDLDLIYIDETHFDFRRNWGVGKAPAGKKALHEGKLCYTSMSAITAISINGPILCHVHVRGNIDAAKFSLFFNDLLCRVGSKRCCFFLDNATVHPKESVVEEATKRNQVVLFNIPYSSELNPIEEFFSCWKRLVMKKAPNANGTQQLQDIVKESFLSIGADTCQSLICHVTTTLYQKVIRKEDI